MQGPPLEEEALRLVLAFYCIMEPEKQAQVLAVAEQLAVQSQLAVGSAQLQEPDRKLVAQ